MVSLLHELHSTTPAMECAVCPRHDRHGLRSGVSEAASSGHHRILACRSCQPRPGRQSHPRCPTEAKEGLVKEGYEVQTVRIVTQPFPELVAGLSDANALAFLKELDQLAAQKEFSANVGPAMLRDADDPHMMQLLAEALAVLPHIQASAIIAGDDGIHWKVIHETAGLVRYVADHSVHGEGSGNLNFTASAMVK